MPDAGVSRKRQICDRRIHKPFYASRPASHETMPEVETGYWPGIRPQTRCGPNEAMPLLEVCSRQDSHHRFGCRARCFEFDEHRRYDFPKNAAELVSICTTADRSAHLASDQGSDSIGAGKIRVSAIVSPAAWNISVAIAIAGACRIPGFPVGVRELPCCDTLYSSPKRGALRESFLARGSLDSKPSRALQAELRPAGVPRQQSAMQMELFEISCQNKGLRGMSDHGCVLFVQHPSENSLPGAVPSGSFVACARVFGNCDLATEGGIPRSSRTRWFA